MLHEMSRKIINLNKYEEINVCWETSVITVRGDKQLHLLEFSYNLNSLAKDIDLKEHTIICKKTSPVPENYFLNYVSGGIRNSELIEMVTNSAFWPHNKLLMEELCNNVEYQWSPYHLQSENDSLLAVVNNLGNVEFFGALRHSWCSIIDFSSLIKTHLNETVDQLCKNPKNFAEVKKTAYFIQTASICWAATLNDDNTCYFVTAQKSGDVLFWSIKYHLGYFESEFCGGIHINDVDILHMFWIPRKENKFLLICSSESGEIISYECQIIEKQLTLLNTLYLWSYKDRMISTYLKFHLQNDRLLLIFNKHRHLVVQMYDKNLKLLFQNVQNVNDHKITSLTKNKDTFYLTTVNRKLYRMNYSVIDETAEVFLEEIEFKDPGPTYELYGVAVSINSAIFALAMINRRLVLKRQSVNIEIFLLSPDTGCEREIDKIIECNPSEKLTNMWDLIEISRCKTLKTKMLPKIDFNRLLNTENVYNLKIYLIILKLYQNLVKCLTLDLKDIPPETSIEVVKEKILVFQALTQIHNLGSRNLEINPLSTFDHDCIAFAKAYVSYYTKKYSKTLAVKENITTFSDVEFPPLCQWCDEVLENFSCKNNHVNMFCSLTFTPIENDYLVCKSCNATARIELFSQSPICVFCDLYLIKA